MDCGMNGPGGEKGPVLVWCLGRVNASASGNHSLASSNPCSCLGPQWPLYPPYSRKGSDNYAYLDGGWSYVRRHEETLYTKEVNSAGCLLKNDFIQIRVESFFRFLRSRQ